MANLIKNFYQSAHWNAFESIFYKSVLTIHQTCLYALASKLIYGFSSLLFAIIYLTVELLNLGLDRSIAQFSEQYFKHKDGFKRYFCYQITCNCLLIIFLAFLTIKYDLINYLLKITGTIQITINQTILICLIIILESLRKTLRLIAQLLFLNKSAALLESSLILIYTSWFWLLILAGQKISLNTIYLPLLGQSVIGLAGLTVMIFNKLRTNFDQQSPVKLSWTNIFICRVQNYLYQLSEILFSSNFLIYFFSNIIGLINIGPIKLANYFAVFFKALLDKTFGLTSLALFAKNKALITNQAVVFNYAQKKLNLLLTGLILVFSACCLLTRLNHNIYYLALLFLIFTLINNFFIVYEQLFLIYNKILVLFFLNLSCLASFGLLYYFYPNFFIQAQVAYLISFLATLRIVSLFFVKIITNSFLQK